MKHFILIFLIILLIFFFKRKETFLTSRQQATKKFNEFMRNDKLLNLNEDERHVYLQQYQCLDYEDIKI
jgi:hypothetical protein